MDEDMVCVCSHANPFFVTDANATTKNDRKNILFKKCSIGQVKNLHVDFTDHPDGNPITHPTCVFVLFRYFFSPCLSKNQWNTCSLGNTPLGTVAGAWYASKAEGPTLPK